MIVCPSDTVTRTAGHVKFFQTKEVFSAEIPNPITQTVDMGVCIQQLTWGPPSIRETASCFGLLAPRKLALSRRAERDSTPHYPINPRANRLYNLQAKRSSRVYAGALSGKLDA